MTVEITRKTMNLAAKEVFRFQCFDISFIKVIEGSAEIFGCQLITNMILDLPIGFRGEILTFLGCKLQYTSDTLIDYTINFDEDHHLPNVYLNIHVALEQMRGIAGNEIRGPRILVCGNKSVGKTMVCRILANYAVRKSRKIVLVDTNVSLNDISIPGTISSIIVTDEYELIEGWNMKGNPLVYSFGDLDPTTNISLYKTQVEALAETINIRTESDEELFVGGCIISTNGVDQSQYLGTDSCGPNQGHVEAIRMVINAFEVNVLVVIGDISLEHLLRPGLPDYVHVIRIPKSSGAYCRSEMDLDRERVANVRSYFHGRGFYKLMPHRLIIKSDKFRIFKINKKIYSKKLGTMC